MEKSTIVAIFLLVCLPFFSETASLKLKPLNPTFTIVIDAGHGGKDSGAMGSIVKEKDIALKLALRLGRYIQEYMPSVQVLYTRTTDRFVPLYERIALANNSQADLFFSIHCNSSLNRSNSVSGTETYVMGLHGVTENLNVAKRENKAVLLEKDYVQNYGGYNPYSSEGHIMLSMYQNAYLSQSLLLAGKVEKQFIQTAKRKSRGVKQAGFLVLRTATMPSVLVETGFLSSSTEEHYLNSEKGQVYTTSAMYRAVKEYKATIESNTNYNYKKVKGVSNPVSKPKVLTLAPAPKSIRKTLEKHEFVRKTVLPQNGIKRTNKTISSTYPAPKVEPSIKEMPSALDMYPTSFSAISSSNVATEKGVNQIVFRVQLAASTQKNNLKEGIWATVKGVECLKIGTAYKFLVGRHSNLNTAVKQQQYWRENGFKDAFIVAFRNGQRISMTEAIR